MEFRILGPLEVDSSGAPPVSLGPPQQRAVLAMLLIHANHSVSSSALIDGLWPDDPPRSASNVIQGYVSRLRKALANGSLRTQGTGYVLDVPAQDIDACRFEELVDRALGDEVADVDRAGMLREALDLWRGPPLCDFSSEHFAQPEIVRLEQLRRRALEARIETDLALGLHGDLISELQSLVREDPLYERAWTYLMLALYRAGRQADALAAFDEARGVLGEELGLDPGPELRALQQQILTQDPALAPPERAAPRRPAHNLPAQLTKFIGREAEIEEIFALLRNNRLITIIGVGGGGKTRLAIEIGTRQVTGFRDGAWFVDLASLTDPAFVPQALASTFGLRQRANRSPIDTVVEFLRHKRALIILDNCEHLVDACAQLCGTLLAACPELTVLATSREALSVAGEIVWPVPTLSLPDPFVRGADDVSRSEAAHMFVTRTRRVMPKFSLTDGNAFLVAEICRRLDGIPLAIELAAARMKTLSEGELLTRLQDRFALLSRSARTTSPRHRTLRSTIDWSYGLLSDEEAALFNRLCVFAGGFTLDAAEEVCARGQLDGCNLLDVLEGLMDKSMLTRSADASGTARYRMLETLREYGREKLIEAGDDDDTRAAHLRWVVRLSEAWEETQGKEFDAWVSRVEAERDNVAAALEWCLASGPIEDGLRIAAALARVWQGRRLEEGRRWIDLLTERLPDAVADPLLEGKFLHAAGQGATIQGRWDEAADRLGQSAERFRRAGEPRGTVDALRWLALSLWGRGAFDRVGPVIEDAATQARALGDPAYIADTAFTLGLWESTRNVARAAALLEEADALTRGERSVKGRSYVGSSHLVAHRREGLALIAYLKGDLDRARSLFAEALPVYGGERELGCALHCMEGVSAYAAAAGDLEGAAELLGAVEAIREQTGNAPRPWERVSLKRCLESIAAGLAPEERRAAWKRGKSMSFEQLLDRALAEISDPAE